MNYKKSLENQISLKDTLDPYYTRNIQRDNDRSALIISFVALTISVCVMIAQCEKMPEPVAVKTTCIQCHNRMKHMTKYFKDAGSKSPEEMANAVLRTNSPRLIAAIATIETGGNYKTKNTGYRKRHHGAFQVNPKYWGKVPKDAVGQALQAERILTELTNEMPIKKALALYGGDSTDKYSRKVLAELVNVP